MANKEVIDIPEEDIEHIDPEPQPQQPQQTQQPRQPKRQNTGQQVQQTVEDLYQGPGF